MRASFLIKKKKNYQTETRVQSGILDFFHIKAGVHRNFCKNFKIPFFNFTGISIGIKALDWKFLLL